METLHAIVKYELLTYIRYKMYKMKCRTNTLGA